MSHLVDLCARTIVFVGISSLLGVFGPAADAATIDWVTVGDAVNTADATTGFGAVDYAYRIGKFEITNGQYAEFLNAVAAEDPGGIFKDPVFIAEDGLYNTLMNDHASGGIQRLGDPGNYRYETKPGRENKPVVFVSFWDAVRFANWQHNGQPTGSQGPATTEDGAYTLTTEAVFQNFPVTRNPGARFFLPTEDEWYKAAYYKGGSQDAGYWDYPTQSDTPPTADVPPGGSNSANFASVADGDYVDVGSYANSPGPFGTFDQGGNVAEWIEAVSGGPTGTGRFFRGGGKENAVEWLSVNARDSLRPESHRLLGFRMGAAVPEPSTFVLAVVGLLGFLAHARRARSRHA